MESPQYQTSCRNATRASARFPARVTFISGAAWDSLSPSSGSFLSPHAVLGLILNSEQLALNGLSELLQPRSRSPFSVFVSAHKAERKTDCNRDDGGCLSVCGAATQRWNFSVSCLLLKMTPLSAFFALLGSRRLHKLSFYVPTVHKCSGCCLISFDFNQTGV